MRSLISSGSNSFNYHRDENLFLSLLSLFNNYPGNNQHAERDYSILCFLQKNNKEELSIVIDIRNISTLILIVPAAFYFTANRVWAYIMTSGCRVFISGV